VAYALHSEGQPTVLANQRSVVASRAAFATKDRWVTAHDAERHPAGDLANQHPGAAGLPAWTAAERD
jgi:primary-amine oxidase